MTRTHASLLRGAAYILVAATAQAGPLYTNDPSVANLTNGITNFAMFVSALSFDVPLPYTPTAATVAQGLRVVGNDDNPPIRVVFPAPVSQIRVFPSIDHLGWAPDGFQYAISGSNDGNTYTPLFNPSSVIGTAEPFMLGSFTGTAPLSVNNVVSPGAGPFGTVGYVADFTFSQPYRYFSFSSSDVVRGENQDEELTAVGSPTNAPVAHMPEPGSYVMMLIGAGAFGLRYARNRRSQ